MTRKKLAPITAALLVSVALAAPAQAQEDEGDTGMSPGAATEANVTLQEWAVIPDALTIPAGSVTFNATNVGPADPHELVIVKTDLPADQLPTRDDGGFDEAAEGVEVIGEIEEFEPETTQSATFDLPPGNYVFLCNLVEEEEGELESHYQMGMWIGVQVTA